MTFQVITVEELGSVLNLSGKALDEAIAARGWSASGGEV
jgi:hypothetical protein